MNRIKTVLHNFSSKKLKGKFPLTALTLHKKLVTEINNINETDIHPFLSIFEFKDLWIFHGVAMEKDGKGILFSGPPGIGKSTVMRSLGRKKIVIPLEDGFVTIGRTDHSYYIVESGLYSSLKVISILSKLLRIITRYKSPYLDHRCNFKKSVARGITLHNLAVLIGSVIIKNNSSEPVKPRLIKLVKLFLVSHPSQIYLPQRAHKESFKLFTPYNTEHILNPYVQCEIIPSCQNNIKRIILEKIINS